MCNRYLKELIRYYGKLSQWIKNKVRGILPDMAEKKKEINKSKREKHKKFNICTIWNPAYKYKVISNI